jgi:Tfp pilus assembly PilM family ATPase/Tfp pilus assembly protein PilN
MLSLGIDLSEEKMDLTLLRDSLRGPRLKAKARFYLPQGETSPAERRQYCGQKLRQFVQENSARGAEVVVGLPRRHFLLRNIAIPAVRREDVNRIMRYEADRHIPWEVGQVYYDTVCPEPVRGAGSMDILFVAIRKQTMDELLEPVRLAGLRLTAIDVSTFASATAYLDRAGKSDGPTAFVEIGEATILLSVLSGGQIRTSRAHSIARMLPQAEEAPDAAATLAEAIARELQAMAHSPAMEPGEKSFTHLVVTGPGSSNPDLVGHLEKLLELEALLYAPLGQRKDLSAEEAADMSRATSLALRGLSPSMQGLNFLPEEQRVVRKDYGPHLAAALVVLLLLQLGILYGHGIYVRRLQLQALEARVAELLPAADKINEIKNEIDTLSSRADDIKNLELSTVPRIVLLSEVVRTLPKETWVEYLRVQGNALTLKVRGDPGLQIASRLAQSYYILDPKLTNQTNDTLSIDATLQIPSKSAAAGHEGPAEEGTN